jgi:hypothetical protein
VKTVQKEGPGYNQAMYIGGGLIVLILIVLLVVFLVGR